ncbi:MAG: TRAP transporter large permease [Rhodospirillaceae bacterium]|nr:TRAP transporter large permease [Rhodospirillaceae bacterium]MBT7770022.1 TRAP transporter large permease [Rhodospirillales bacterium]MBT4700504.1 TRAP transporter large permease [Rhodospirillaceae bacterium]MBT5033472.1 TRAP transporter large permease [Rhodospirillaceae bacterium]MBT6221334.1 TRAP transporter large permease [Rhodospirillaceae bacterium]
MFEVNIAAFLVVCLVFLVAIGVHIAIALGMTSALGIFLVLGGDANAFRTVQVMLAAKAYEGIRDYVFAVIPLFLLMGEFIGKSGAVTDVYRGLNAMLKKIPGRLAIATVLGNALFSFVTGVSIASAATFSRIAYPEMKRHGYHKGFALGTVAGSSCLGMLIPPSVLMIVWGILTEVSIGRIFLAGVLPGLMLTSLFIIYVIVMALIKPEAVGAGSEPVVEETASDVEEVSLAQFSISLAGIFAVVVAVLGGIWFGYFSPTEGAGVGAFLGLILGILKGMRYREIVDSILAVGRTSGPILLLLVTAALYSNTLAMTGLANAIESLFLESGMASWMVIAVMILIWFLLGMIIDSISIMLLTAAIFAPIAVKLGYDPVAFAIIGIISIEAGLLTPPFGLLVYTVKAAINDQEPDLNVMSIFKSSTPYWILMLIGMVLIINFQGIATYLPKLLF